MKVPLIWRRSRDATPQIAPDELRATWQLVSVLLQYPDDELVANRELLAGVAGRLPRQIAEPLRRYLTHVGSSCLRDLQSQYVDTFDITRKCSLHLTYFTHGDTRRRGVALVQFKQAFRRAGAQLADENAELPDYLPAVLEFGAFTDRDTAWKLLGDYRVGIELVRAALARTESPWLDVVEALRATLPQLDEDDEVALRTLIAQGPPDEEVGLHTSPYTLDPSIHHATNSRLNPRPEPVDLGSTIPVGASR